MTDEREDINPDDEGRASETAADTPPEEGVAVPDTGAPGVTDGAAESPESAAVPPAAAPVGEALPVVEALLFAASKPAPVEKLAEAAELSVETVEAALAALETACAADGRGVRLDRVAGGVRLVSRPEYDYPVRRLLGLDGRTKLSMAALETLAIVAYRQPVTGPEVAELRGVNSSSSIRTLLDRKLITTAGRKEVVGTPFLYKTTKEFLVHFGLKGLTDLPKPEELEAIYGLEAPKPDPAQVELFHVDEATGELEETDSADGPLAAPDGPTDAIETTGPAAEEPAPASAEAAPGVEETPDEHADAPSEVPAADEGAAEGEEEAS